ncbi:polysaccharide pyruvyl transferase family protein [Faecalibacterium sp. An77]|uniref:polysaccharide pyruvyl transferase family protein n=1 Tax=Faecalibacterium sp. An77 TaxID=1965655 RepID=UPI0013025D8A|nr:polysaccharide pyruvyl transferase family protein [Faecalibacterium sp. An77]
MNYFFYQTKTKYDNTGDALINKALISELRKYGRVFANCSAYIPVEFLEELEIRKDEQIICKNSRQFALKIIGHALLHRQDNTYIVSGLGDIYGGGVKKVMRNVLSACVLPVYSLLGVKNVRIGRSFGVMTKAMQWSEALRGLFVNSYFVRDTQSLQRCRSMGISKVQLCPDMSWIYEEGTERQENASDVVMINMKGSTLNIKEQKYIDALIKKCKTFLERLEKEKNKKVHVLVAYQVSEDEEFSQYIYQRLKDEFDVEFVDTQMKLGDLRKYYSHCGYHLSNRMHSLLSGYKYGSLPVALIDVKNHLKIAATLKDCDLDEFMIDVFDEFPESKMDNILTNKSKLYRKITICEVEQAEKIHRILSREFDRGEEKE